MHKSKQTLAVICSIAFSISVFAEVDLSPLEIEFADFSKPGQVRVTQDGKPVLPGEIMKIVSGVFKYRDDVPENATGKTHFSNYSYMFDFRTNDDGSITVIPIRDAVEIGSYDLYVHTIYGTATGTINVNLRNVIPPRPLQSVDMGKFIYSLDLPDYEYGQTISINLGADTKNIYTWYLNGEVRSSGLGQTSFEVRPEPGIQEISFIARTPDGEVHARGSGNTTIRSKKTSKK